MTANVNRMAIMRSNIHRLDTLIQEVFSGAVSNSAGDSVKERRIARESGGRERNVNRPSEVVVI